MVEEVEPCPWVLSVRRLKKKIRKLQKIVINARVIFEFRVWQKQKKASCPASGRLCRRVASQLRLRTEQSVPGRGMGHVKDQTMRCV